MKSVLALAALALLFTGCPKKADTTNVAGTDDEQMDQLTAKLEEMRAKAKADEVKCPDWCSLAKQVCDFSHRTCEISGRHADRMDMQQRCAQSQEDCVSYNDGCAKCG